MPTWGLAPQTDDLVPGTGDDDAGSGPGNDAGGGCGPEFIASQPYVISTPAQGQAETESEEWVAALRASWAELRRKLEAAGLDTAVSSIGLDGQMYGFVPMDASGRAFFPAIRGLTPGKGS